MTRAAFGTTLIALLISTEGVMAQSPTPAERPLTETSASHWHDFIRPKADELAWQAIPWRTTLLAALRDAEDVDKPILLWAMNGHPLSCT